jgi:hypothetical protein
MPIYADWRHPPIEHASLAQGGGPMMTKNPNPDAADADDDDEPTPSTTEEEAVSETEAPPRFFCLYDDTIEKRLQALHARQRVQGDVQHEIDVYLVTCIAPYTTHLCLPRHSVPHYDNLPDISAYALGILDPAMDSDPELQQVLLLLRQCTPLRRRTKRAQREVQWREDSCFPMQTLVRCMQGTLLGLYPNCVKGIAFSARVAFYRFLRTLLVQPFAKLHAALTRIPYLTKLAVMEHLCNTIYDYHPGICHTLNRSGQKVEHFCDSVSNICSIFRTELNTLFCTELHASGAAPSTSEMDAILFRILPRLERTSHSFYERSTRAYRGIIIGAARPVRSIDVARRLLPGVLQLAKEGKGTGAGGLADQLERVFATGTNPTLFELVHTPRFANAQLRDLLWHVTQLLQVHALPACIALRQHEALKRRYGDSVRTRQCRMLHLCVQCVIRKGTATGIRLRHDCMTNALACRVCGPGTVVAIDMVGRMVQVVNEFLLLSSCCGMFIFYHGSGFEFMDTCGIQCASSHQLFRKRERNTTTVATTTMASSTTASACCSCLICGVRASITQTFRLLDPPRREMRPYAMCSKHMVPAHILSHAYTREDLFRYFALRTKSRKEASHKNDAHD